MSTFCLLKNWIISKQSLLAKLFLTDPLFMQRPPRSVRNGYVYTDARIQRLSDYFLSLSSKCFNNYPKINTNYWYIAILKHKYHKIIQRVTFAEQIVGKINHKVDRKRNKNRYWASRFTLMANASSNLNTITTQT